MLIKASEEVGNETYDHMLTPDRCREITIVGDFEVIGIVALFGYDILIQCRLMFDDLCKSPTRKVENYVIECSGVLTS